MATLLRRIAPRTRAVSSVASVVRETWMPSGPTAVIADELGCQATRGTPMRFWTPPPRLSPNRPAYQSPAVPTERRRQHAAG